MFYFILEPGPGPGSCRVLYQSLSINVCNEKTEVISFHRAYWRFSRRRSGVEWVEFDAPCWWERWLSKELGLPSLELAASLNLEMDGWNTIVSFGARPIFRGELLVSRSHLSVREFFFC